MCLVPTRITKLCLERHGVAKGFADYVYPPEQNVYHISDHIDLQSAALAEPLSCVIHGLDLIQIQSGKTVVIYGMGSIGSLMLQLVHYTGAGKIIVIEKETNKQKLALKLGANMAIDSDELERLVKKKILTM